jgi:hypothetical protein
MPEVDFPIVSQTNETYIDSAGFTHTVTTTVRHGVPLGRRTAATSAGGHLAAPASTCSFLGRDVFSRTDQICGGGCMTQNLQRTIDEYSNDADTVNTYHGRVEYRLWWTRQYSTGPLLHRECFHGVA